MRCVTPPETLPVARYRFTAEMQDDLHLPSYAGSLMRGVFGAALRRCACMTRQRHCPDCPLWRSCPYPALFETPPQPTALGQQFSQVPNPYVIEPPLGLRELKAGELLVFNMVLIGSGSLNQLPLIIHAWQRALHQGLGERRARARLLGVEYLPPGIGQHLPPAQVVYDTTADAPARLQPHNPQWPLQQFLANSPAQPEQALCLRLHTPLRLQHDGQALKAADLSPRVLLAQLLRRCHLLLEQHAGVTQPLFDAPALLARVPDTVRDDRSGLHWRAWQRYSSRQQQEMPLGGVVGEWHLQGELAPFWPWLQLGQWLHLGKNTTLGLGEFSLT